MSYLNMLSSDICDAIGVAGFGLYVLNYALLTVQRMQADQICYFVMNGLAAAMVLIGLTSAFNLASALIQVFWIAISIVAVVIRLNKPKPLQFTHQRLD